MNPNSYPGGFHASIVRIGPTSVIRVLDSHGSEIEMDFMVRNYGLSMGDDGLCTLKLNLVGVPVPATKCDTFIKPDLINDGKGGSEVSKPIKGEFIQIDD
tara:strand:- start:1026 stop:1325 length:300 start_codon:yes stop_codon:yes gene_type:complete